jgi:hypothetical protein
LTFPHPTLFLLLLQYLFLKHFILLISKFIHFHEPFKRKFHSKKKGSLVKYRTTTEKCKVEKPLKIESMTNGRRGGLNFSSGIIFRSQLNALNWGQKHESQVFFFCDLDNRFRTESKDSDRHTNNKFNIYKKVFEEINI